MITREVIVTISCTCGFWVQQTFYTNEHGYFEIPQAYCPNCFHLLNMKTQNMPVYTLQGDDETQTESTD